MQVKDDERAKLDEFWKLNHYVAGSYDKAADFQNLDKKMEEIGNKHTVNRLFYLALPPTVYANVSDQIHKNCMAKGYLNHTYVCSVLKPVIQCSVACFCAVVAGHESS